MFHRSLSFYLENLRLDLSSMQNLPIPVPISFLPSTILLLPWYDHPKNSKRDPERARLTKFCAGHFFFTLDDFYDIGTE